MIHINSALARGYTGNPTTRQMMDVGGAALIRKTFRLRLSDASASSGRLRLYGQYLLASMHLVWPARRSLSEPRRGGEVLITPVLTQVRDVEERLCLSRP
jgi:hypothetical protein